MQAFVRNQAEESDRFFIRSQCPRYLCGPIYIKLQAQKDFNGPCIDKAKYKWLNLEIPFVMDK